MLKGIIIYFSPDLQLVSSLSTTLQCSLAFSFGISGTASLSNVNSFNLQEIDRGKSLDEEMDLHKFFSLQIGEEIVNATFT